MARKEGPEIDFYEGFKVADSFQKFVTAGDLGGTKERLLLYGQREDGTVEKIVRANWFGEEVESIKDMFAEYHTILQDNNLKQPEEAVLGCAGIIEDEGKYCNFTNIALEVSTEELAEMGLDVELINDFFANAQQIPWLKELDREEIPHKYEPENPGPNPSKAMAVLGPGTGLGVASIYWDEEKGYHPQPSEGGHKAWSPRNDLEWSLYNYLKAEITDGRDPDVETVASGRGLANIVNFLCYGRLPKGKKDKKIQKIKDLRKGSGFQKFVKNINAEEPQVAGRQIIRAYKDKRYSVILKYAVNIFVAAVAAAARDVVHDFCAYNGVYISGGNARRLRKAFLSGRFMEVFDQSYEHTDKLRGTPVYLVTSRTLGTDGAARHAFSRSRK
ncbi:glucokinase [Candidatus Poribacteria bacterium]